jgi:hypothetical protein
MSCREIQDRLADDLQAAASDPAVVSHLASCDVCRTLAGKLARVDGALAGLAAGGPDAPPDWVVDRTLARVEARPLGRPRARRRLRWAAVATAASVCTLLLVSGVMVMGDKVRMLTATSANALAGNENTDDLPDQFAQLRFKGEEGKAGAKRLHGHRSMKDFSEVNRRGETETTTADLSARVPTEHNAVADPHRDLPTADDGFDQGDEGGVAGNFEGGVVAGIVEGPKERPSTDTGKRDGLHELDRRLGRYEQTRTRLMWGATSRPAPG